MPDIVTPAHYQAATKLRELMGLHREHEDLITIGAYRKGSHPKLDVAIQFRDDIDALLKQHVDSRFTFEESRDALIKLVTRIEDRLRTPVPQAGKEPQNRQSGPPIVPRA